NGRDARAQGGARVPKGLERRERVRLPDLNAEVRLAVEREMAVAVDHPRQHESAGRRGDLGALALRRPRASVPRTDPPAVAALDPSLKDGVKQIVVVLADGLGLAQLRALSAAGDMPFVTSILERARRHDRAQLIEATTIFPSTTAAAITTLNTARTPQEHGNI